MCVEFICKYCGKQCKNKNSLAQHEIRCKENPNRLIIISNFIKYSEKRRKLNIKSENQYTKAKRLGLSKPELSEETKNRLRELNKGRKVSEETKQKISNTQKNNYKGGKCCWSTAVEKRLSYAEQYFIPIFNDAKLHYHVNRFFLDFAWPDKNIYLEVDGSQHKYDKKVVLHDIERTEILKNDGWTLITRIYWPDFVKLSFEEKEIFIKDIKEKIENWDISPMSYTH